MFLGYSQKSRDFGEKKKEKKSLALVTLATL